MAPAPRRATDQADILVLAGGGLAHTSGGVGTLMLALMEHWKTQPHAPRLCVIDTRGPGNKRDGVRQFLIALTRLAARASTGRVSLVHAHMTTRGSALRKSLLCGLAMALRVPVIMHMHGADFFAFYRRLHPIPRALLCAILQRATTILVLGQAWHAFLTNELAIDPERITIIDNAVAAPSQPRPLRPATPVQLLFLGRIGTRKGVPELIQALAHPMLRTLPWHATIAGDGDIAATRAAIHTAGLASRITIPGWVDRPATERLLAHADILLLPSHDEAMPMALLEALAHHVAIITTPVGAIPEFLQHRVNALLVQPGAVDDLAAAISLLVTDAPLRRILTQAGYQLFRTRFDIAIAADKILRIYGSIGKRKRFGFEKKKQQAFDPALMRRLLWRVGVMQSQADVRVLLDGLEHRTESTIVSFVNQHAINLCWSDKSFFEALNISDILLRDGVGAELALATLGLPAGRNMVGTSFLPLLIARHAHRRVALYGTAEPWLSRAVHTLRNDYRCNIVAAIDGFQPQQNYIDNATSNPADLIILAMGMPKQEILAAALASAISHPALIVNGGAIADYLAQHFPRAPAWFRTARLEWAFRLMLEPRRLWRRYGPGSLLFARNLLALRVSTARE